MSKRTNRGIDHVVLAVRDLEAARARFGSFGFTVTPPAVHPFGTGNSLIQYSDSFVELLTVVAPNNIVPMAAQHFSFSRFCADFLARREGMPLLVLTSDDARGDNEVWRAHGLRTFDAVDFARAATLPDGSQAEVAFTIAFAVDPASPDAAFFVVQHHRPENFWQPAYQHHRNGGRQIVGVTMAAPEPERHADFFRLFVPEAELDVGGGRLVVRLPRGRIEVLDEAALSARFPPGVAAPAALVPSFVATTIAVDDPAAAASGLSAAKVSYRGWRGGIVIPARHCFGLAIELVPRAAETR